MNIDASDNTTEMNCCSILWKQVQGEVREGGGDRPVHQVLQHLLQGVRVRPLRDLWQQARVPLLPRQAQLQGQA